MHTKRFHVRSRTVPKRIRLAVLASFILLLPVSSALATPAMPSPQPRPAAPHFSRVDGRADTGDGVRIHPAEESPHRLIRTSFGPGARQQLQRTQQLSTTVETLLYDGFESEPWPYPGTLWARYYVDTERYWDDVSYNANSSYGGAWSAWPAADGVDGKIPSPEDDNYPNNTQTWMIYGPVDLRGNAVNIDWFFANWRELAFGDFTFFGVSTNSQDFFGYVYRAGDNNDWSFEHVNLNNYIGQSQVWLGWYFESDADETARGTYIDDVFLFREVPVASTSSRVSVPVAGFSPPPPRPSDPCATYEPNNRLSEAKPFGTSGSTIRSTMCAGDKDDFFYFTASRAGTVQITLNLPQPLYKEGTLNLYDEARRDYVGSCYKAPPINGRTGTTKPITASCSVQPGKYYLWISSLGTTSPSNQYTVQVKYP